MIGMGFSCQDFALDMKGFSPCLLNFRQIALYSCYEDV
jgi:hypothetical protein